MSGPFIPARAGQPLDMLEQGPAGGGWEELDRMFRPHLETAPLQPDDSVAKFLFGLYSTAEGRALIEWLMDITLRMPLRATGSTFEQTALLTATRQGINGVGEAVLNAIAHGEKLVHQQNNQGAK